METISDHGKNNIHGAAVLVLCAIFFIFSIGIVLFGCHIYRSVVYASDQNYTQRTALSFLVNKARSGDTVDGIWLEQFGDGDAVVLREDGSTYQTRLYCCNGFLCELYCEPDAGLLPEDGSIILPLASLTARREGSLLHLTVQEKDGSVYEVSLCHRCGFDEEVAS